MAKETKTSYNFGEKDIEKVKEADGYKELKVWKSPKFIQSREKAIQLIESDFGLDTGDFWILMNKGGGKMIYSGLIISHNGCLKINDKLEDKMKFRPSAVSFLKDNDGDKVMQYVCDEQGIYEFGEIATSNCKNQYPYAMVLKRLMDRTILKASKIGYFGIYSENESDDFRSKNEEPEEKPKNQPSDLVEAETITSEQGLEIEELCKKKGVEINAINTAYKIHAINHLPTAKFNKVIATLKAKPDAKQVVVVKDDNS